MVNPIPDIIADMSFVPPSNWCRGANMLTIDADQIVRFTNALFRYADPDTWASLRAFYDDQNGVFAIESVKIGDGLYNVELAASKLAQDCASAMQATVFCPPVATFSKANKADEASLANGLALSVECDQQPNAARYKLESILGLATIVVQSGGEWINPDTGEVEDKIHLHWRLKEPTRSMESHMQLKLARTLATALVGGDASNKPIVHPIRWPGSWHRKGTPRLAQIASEAEREIELADVLESLSEAVRAAGVDSNSANEKTGTSDKTSSESRDIRVATYEG